MNERIEVWGDGCECFVVPKSMWTTHYGAVEPGSQVEWNPNCPKHGEDAATGGERMSETERTISRRSDVPHHQYAAVKAVLAERERELLQLKGPCSTGACCLHYAHAGPCDVPPPARRRDADPTHERDAVDAATGGGER